MFEGFRTVISGPRLDKYRGADSTELEVLTYCLFNTALCESFYPSLQFLEVGLRNSIYNALHFTTKDPKWFKSAMMCNRCLEDVETAENTLIDNGKDPDDPNAVVAELNFGFWVRLFNKHYQIPLWNNKAFHSRALPNASSLERVRYKLAVRLDEIRRFRNRVFHHERILPSDLRSQHTKIIEMIGWISTELATAHNLVDRFDNVYCATYYTQLQKSLEPLI